MLSQRAVSCPCASRRDSSREEMLMLRTRSARVRVVSRRSLPLMLLILFAATGSSFAASQPPFQVQTVLYQASSYGVYADLGNMVLAGPTASADLQEPCGTNNDHQLINGTAAGVNLAPLISGGATNTTAQSFPNQTSQATADVVSLNLLAGLISAQEVKSVSTTSLDSSGFHLSAAGSSFTNLVVLGVPYNGLPAPNTRIDLPAIGYVVLNEQTTF